MPKRDRGAGSIYLRGRRWWIAYFDSTGKQVCESSRSEQRQDAIKLLRRRLGEVDTGTYQGRAAEAVTFEDLAGLLRADYALKGNRSVPRMELALTALAGTFAGQRVLRITYERIAAYATERRAAGKAASTVRTELAMLRRAFRLARRARLVRDIPDLPSINVRNARQGFCEPAQLEALCRELPPYLAPVARFAYLTGWRKEEILGLTWDGVNFETGMVRLEVRTTKNDDGRDFPFDEGQQLQVLLAAQRRDTDVIAQVIGRPIPWVFHRHGQRIRDHYHAWRLACQRAGAAGLLLHDFRRAATRNLDRVGVSQSVAMKLTGHKTPSIYQRYAIVAPADLKAAVAKLSAALTTEQLQSRPSA